MITIMALHMEKTPGVCKSPKLCYIFVNCELEKVKKKLCKNLKKQFWMSAFHFKIEHEQSVSIKNLARECTVKVIKWKPGLEVETS